MKIKRLFKLLALPVAIMLAFMNGCSSAKPEIGKEQAVAIAKQEVTRRGWKELEVMSSNLEGKHWVIMLERLPKVWGGHATVEVSTNGKVVRFLPGK
jgi:hypothetical protein